MESGYITIIFACLIMGIPAWAHYLLGFSDLQTISLLLSIIIVAIIWSTDRIIDAIRNKPTSFQQELAHKIEERDSNIL